MSRIPRWFSSYVLCAAILLKIAGLEEFGSGQLHHLVDGLTAAVFALAMHHQARNQWLTLAVVLLASIAWILDVVGYEPGSFDTETLLWGTTHFLIAATLGRCLLNKPTITRYEVVDTISVYLVTGLAFGELYSLILWSHPGALVMTSQSGNQQLGYDLVLYFSFVTQASLGYGDIVPAHKLSRLACIMQSLLGVMFTAVVFARVVSLHIENRRSASTPGIHPATP